MTTHRLEVVRDGAVALDGVAMREAALAARLATVARDERATLVMRTDPAARYARFLAVLAVVKRAGVTRLGFEGLNRTNWRGAGTFISGAHGLA